MFHRDVSVLIIEDDDDALATFSAWCIRQGLTVFSCATDSAALAVLNEQKPDVIVLDLYLNGNAGADTLTIIRSAAPTVPIVIITGRPSLDTAVAAIRLGGVIDYLEKPFDLNDLTKAITTATLNNAQETGGERVSLKMLGLSARETEVAQLLLEGRNAMQIANELNLSPGSTRNLMARVYDRLGVHNRADAIVHLRKLK